MTARKRRGLLIVPAYPSDSFWGFRHVLRLIGRKAVYPPLGLLTFAGYLPESEWELELIDLNVRRFGESALRRRVAAADVAFISAMSIQKRSLVEFLQGAARGTGTPMVLGGPFASSFRGQIMEPQCESDRVLHEGLDVLVWGEAKGAMPALQEYLASAPRHDAGPPRLLIPERVAASPAGSRSYVNDRGIFPPLEGVPLPRWDLIDVKKYDSMMVHTMAGCPFRCDFCDIIQLNGGFSRPKPPEDVRRELEAILATGFRGGVFTVDDNFIGAPAATARLLDTLIEFQRAHGYPFSFLTQASVDLGTPKLMHLIDRMRLAGFQSVFLGIENPDPDALRAMNKKQNLKVDLAATVSALQAQGIEVSGGFILGSDEDDVSTAQRIVAFVKRTRIFTAMTGILTPVPYTPLYQRLEHEGRLRPTEYTGNNTHDRPEYEPARMSAAELQQGSREIADSLFLPAELYRRALDSVAAVQHQIFSSGRFSPRYLKAAAASIWGQGVRPHDARYFRLLAGALALDRHARKLKLREARSLMRALRRAARRGAEWLPDTQRLNELAALAKDYMVRCRPQLELAEITAMFAELRARIERGTPTVSDVRLVVENAAANLKLQARAYRFPGIKLRKAFEAAIRGWHYQKAITSPYR